MQRPRQNKTERTIRHTKCIPERTCVGCKTRRRAQDLLRLACAPQGDIILDRSGRLPGRGAYVCFDAACLRKALRPGRLAFAFKRSVEAPAFETMCQTAVALLHERLGACLGMAQKAGAVISGHTPLHKALARANIVCMVLATDIAVSRAEEYHAWCAQQNIPCLTFFTKEGLGNLIGKVNRSAVGLIKPRFRELFCSTMASLDKLCSGDVSGEASSGHSQPSF